MRIPSTPLLAICTVFLALPSLQAQTLTYGGGTPDLTNLTNGTWDNTTTSNWFGSSFTTWQGNGTTALFDLDSAGSVVNPLEINVVDAISVETLQFNMPTAATGIELLDGGGSLSNGANPLTFLAVNDPGGSPPDDGGYTISVATQLTGTGGMTFESQFGFRNASTQTLELTNASNSISGPINVISNKDNGNGVTRLSVTSDAALGASGNVLSLEQALNADGWAQIGLDFIGTLTHEIQQNQTGAGSFNDNAGIFLAPTSEITVAQDGLLTGSGVRTFRGDGTSGGTVEFTFASSTDTGDYEIEQGVTLILNNGNQIGAGSIAFYDNAGIQANGTFTIINEIETDRSNGGPNFIDVVGGETLTLTDFGNTGDTRNNRQFAKQGTGTLNLDDTNGWDGDGGGFVYVQEGTLLANNDSGSATGQASVVVESGATLGGGGILAPGFGQSTNRQFTAESGAMVSPGEFGANDTGVLTLDFSRTALGAEFLAGAEFTFDLNSMADLDQLAFTDDNLIVDLASSDVIFNGNTINFNDLTGGILALGNYTLMTFDADTTFEGTLVIGTGLSSYAGSSLIFNDDSSVVLNLVPEPSTALLALVGLIPLLRRRRQA